MKCKWITAAVLCAVCYVTKTASADDGAGAWTYRADLFTTMPLVGYEPATVLSDDGTTVYDAAAAPRRIFRFGGDFIVEGVYGAFQLRPYSDVRYADGGVKVRTGGLEGRVGTPFSYWIGAGFYHHSSHNFSDGAYGFGTNLNALYLDLRWAKRSFDLFGGTATMALRTEAYYFMQGYASPYVLTETAKVAPARIGETSWRGVVRIKGVHPYGRMDASFTMNGDGKGRPASMVADLPVTFRAGPHLLGTFGEHLYVGPYLTMGWNLNEWDAYGSFVWSAGLRMDLVVVDTTR